MPARNASSITSARIKLVILVTIAVLAAVLVLRSYLAPERDKVSRIVDDPSGVTVVEPRNVEEVVSAIKLAKRNGMKVTAMGAGHSYYFMKDFPKLQAENLMIIDTKNMGGIKYAKDRNRVVIGAAARTRDISRLNRELNGIWCPHGLCGGIGLGFWLNSISGVGGVFLPCSQNLNSGIACDRIRKVSFVDSNGDYIETEDRSDVFKALKMCGGMFGVVTSIEVEPFNTPPPVVSVYAIKETATGCKEFANMLPIVTDLSSKDMMLMMCYWYSWPVLVVTHSQHTSRAHIESTLTNKYHVEWHRLPSPLSSYFSTSINNIDLTLAYKVLLGNDWDAYHVGVPCASIDNTFIDKLLDIYHANPTGTLMFTSAYLPERFRMASNPDNRWLWMEMNMPRGNPASRETFEKLDRLIDPIPGRTQYLNVPHPGRTLEDYITPHSDLTYEEFIYQKRFQDPDNMFVTRFNLES